MGDDVRKEEGVWLATGARQSNVVQNKMYQSTAQTERETLTHPRADGKNRNAGNTTTTGTKRRTEENRIQQEFRASSRSNEKASQDVE